MFGSGRRPAPAGTGTAMTVAAMKPNRRPLGDIQVSEAYLAMMRMAAAGSRLVLLMSAFRPRISIRCYSLSGTRSAPSARGSSL